MSLSLINSSSYNWDEQLVRTLFWEEDLDYILQIPVSHNSSPDKFGILICLGFIQLIHLARTMKENIARAD